MTQKSLPQITPSRCPGCFRPQAACYCDLLPQIDNQTEIVFLQHPSERSHPFNTARMAHRSLRHSRLICGDNAVLADADLKLGPHAGLLYPGPQAVDLAELPPDQLPQQLVLVDGTWSQARTMVRDVPSLRQLNCYKLSPANPGQYRIRLEPNDTSLSTVEATIAALRSLEPKTTGCEQLMVAFQTMIQRQLDHPKVNRHHYSGGPKSGRTANIPKRLLGDPTKIVIAYGESAYRGTSGGTDSDKQRPPLVWTAQRLDQSELFWQVLEPKVPLTQSFLEHLDLPLETFEDESVSQSQFCQRWQAWIQPDDLLVVFSPGTLKLLGNIGCATTDAVTLKSIDFQQINPPGKNCRSLKELIDDQWTTNYQLPSRYGRAGRRLASALAMVAFLRASRCREP